jgi:hypothetical protein
LNLRALPDLSRSEGLDLRTRIKQIPREVHRDFEERVGKGQVSNHTKNHLKAFHFFKP